MRGSDVPASKPASTSSTAAPANDTLTGLAGKDTFQFSPNFGIDTITDFTPGQDVIQFASSMFANQQAILDATTDVSGVAVITVGSNTITLNVAESALNLPAFRLV